MSMPHFLTLVRFKLLKVALCRKVIEDFYLSKEIFQISIPSRTSEFPAHNSKPFNQIVCSRIKIWNIFGKSKNPAVPSNVMSPLMCEDL